MPRRAARAGSRSFGSSRSSPSRSAAWLAWDTLSKEGPTIKISFDSGEGLQAGQSQLKYKDIVFGTVKSLALAPDQTHVIVTVATTHAGRAAADRRNGVLGRQAAALRRQYLRHRDPAFGLLCRHVAGCQGGQEPAGFRRTRGSSGSRSACPGTHLSVEIQADRLGLGRLADLFPRPQCRRGARLGHRRHGGIRDDPCLCPGAV